MHPEETRSPVSGTSPGRTALPDERADAAHVARALAAELPPALAPGFDARFIHSCELYEEFVHRLVLGVVRRAGLAAAAATPGTATEVAARAGCAPDRAMVVDWLLRHLATRGLVRAEPAGREGRRFHAAGLLPTPDPAPCVETQRRLDPSWLPAYTLAEVAAAHYPAFLRGETTGEAVLFGPARLGLWEAYFSNTNGLYAVNNRVGALAVGDWAPPGPLTILELGGGLGSGAVALLEHLAATGRLDRVRAYRFTELVPAFLRRGQRALESRFPGASVLACAPLDMDRPFEPQGVPPGSVSVVYAVNTLHVAHDLEVTLAEVVRALAPGGLLVLSECVRLWPDQPVYVEFVFNLMERFRSPRLHPAYRPTGGFLTPEQWQAAFEAVGLTGVRWLPHIARLRHRFPRFHVAAVGATRPVGPVDP